MGKVTHEFKYGDHTLTLETGEFARQAGGSCLVLYRGVAILVTATMAKEPREDTDFFPLLVDFEERMYAAGKFPGGFFKREGRPSDEAILNARKIDRTIRPLFPSWLRNEVQVVATALSVDQLNPPDALSIIGASAALALSDIPFDIPVAAIRVAQMHGEFILSPTYPQLQESTIDILVGGTSRYVNMIESQCKEASESDILECIKLAQGEIDRITKEISAFVDKVSWRKEKIFPPNIEQKSELEQKAKELLLPRIAPLFPSTSKLDLYDSLRKIKKEVAEMILLEFPDLPLREIEAELDKTIIKVFYRNFVFENNIRVDGRDVDTVREISGRVGLLPRVHGSAAFTRGQTQIVSCVTLGTFADRQKIDTANVEIEKRFVHHYNFPPYSVGEVRSIRGPGRREIGHGALVEKALEALIPPENTFPYSIRVVSEVTESNASSSMASTCASSMALMDSGVPIARAVGGVSIGLLYESDERYVLLTDLSGFEDHYGDMDFKIAGTEVGITAIQLDTKIEGLPLKIIEESLAKAKEARLFILSQMNKVISRPRESLSEFAPTLLTLQIPVDKIGQLIGPAGRHVKKIQSDTGASIDIDENGTVYISGYDKRGVYKAHEIIKTMTQEIELDMVFEGTVVSLVPFGAFIELVPGRDGLLHISNIANHRISRVEDYLKIGDRVLVRVKEIDSAGKINLVREDLEYTKPREGRHYPERTTKQARRENDFKKAPHRTRKDRF